MGLGVEQVSGVLALLLHAHAQALAMLDQELRRAVMAAARPTRAPQPDDDMGMLHCQRRRVCAMRA